MKTINTPDTGRSTLKDRDTCSFKGLCNLSSPGIYSFRWSYGKAGTQVVHNVSVSQVPWEENTILPKESQWLPCLIYAPVLSSTSAFWGHQKDGF